MYEVIHGGDIYQNQVAMDFSVNVNPLGIPFSVRRALIDAVNDCEHYPDIQAAKLTDLLSEKTETTRDKILCGNGASELFLAIIHGVRPKKILIPVPSFYGYEKAAMASGAEIVYYTMKEEEKFALTDRFLHALTEDIDLIFLANPNNPTGNLIPQELLLKIINKAQKHKIKVVIDECFIEFTKDAFSFLRPGAKDYDNVIVVRAFTKIYAIPGVRLGYLICYNKLLFENLKNQLPEWNLSSFAQAAGIAALQEETYLKRTVSYVAKERKFLIDELRKIGIKVYPSTSNFLLLYSEVNLYQKFLKEKILIRDCSNYRGLKKGYYRIAVRTHEENMKLLETAGKIIDAD